MRALASSRLLPFLTFLPSRRLTHFWSNTAGMGLMAESLLFSCARCSGLSTLALAAAVYASSGMGSQPPKTRSSRRARGTRSLIFAQRFSLRLPRRSCAICVSDPMGLLRPAFTASTPAMKVVATAPIPGKRTASFPSAGATFDLN